MARRRPRGLPDPHAEASHQQLTESLDEARRQGEAAPQEESDRDDRSAYAPVRPTSDRNPRERIEERERGASQEAHRGVRDAELLLDGFDQHPEDLPVEHVEDRDAEENSQDVGRVGGGNIEGGGRIPCSLRQPYALARFVVCHPDPNALPVGTSEAPASSCTSPPDAPRAGPRSHRHRRPGPFR